MLLYNRYVLIAFLERTEIFKFDLSMVLELIFIFRHFHLFSRNLLMLHLNIHTIFMTMTPINK